MPRQNRNHHQRRAWPCPRFDRSPGRAFTLMELLVVIAIMSILMLSVFPIIGVMARLTRGGAGANTINVAVTAARAYAVRDRSGPFSIIGPPPTVSYSGSAILFTPSNQLFLLENVPGAGNGGSLLEPLGLNGYGPIAGRDPIKLQNSVGVFGISRVNSGGPALRLLAPPFAVRFDRNGNLVVGGDRLTTATTASSAAVIFDSDFDGDYEVDRIRDSTYSPDDYNPKIVSTVAANPITGGYTMPVEYVECVIGVIAYPAAEFRNLVQQNFASGKMPGELLVPDGDTDLTDTPEQRLAQWLLDNGQVLFFSRTTGNLFRESRAR